MKLYELMDVMHDGQSCISIRDGERKYCGGYDDGVEWLKKEPWYQEIRNFAVLGVAMVAGDCDGVDVCIRVAGENGAKAAAKKDYEHAADRILGALENCKVPVTWHEVNRPKLLQMVAQELERLERGEA